MSVFLSFYQVDKPWEFDKLLEKESYDEVIEAVKTGEVFAAVVNSDIIHWRYQEIKDSNIPLAVVHEIKMSVPVRMNVEIYGNNSIWECIQQFRSEILEVPRRKYFKHVEVI